MPGGVQLREVELKCTSIYILKNTTKENPKRGRAHIYRIYKY
jgi:hypothetical protein